MIRRMASIRTINTVEPIEGADRIEYAKVGGWGVVVGKDSGFTAGDKAVFFEIDSLLNQNHPAFSDVAKRGVKTMRDSDGNTMTFENGDDMTGHVLRTIRLRGVYSQGMLVPLNVFGLTGDETPEEVDEVFRNLVVKWEPPLPKDNRNPNKGTHALAGFPAHIRKTDSERVQNLTPEFLASLNPNDWFATEKIDGTSTTFWKDEEGGFHVATRNWEVNPASMHQDIIDCYDIESRLENGEFVQGEIFGEGVQGNKLKISGLDFRVFNASNIEAFKDIAVPALDLEFPASIDDAIAQVDGMKSTINTKVLAEGVVWWNKNGEEFLELGLRPNFKAINNKFLAKEKD